MSKKKIKSIKDKKVEKNTVSLEYIHGGFWLSINGFQNFMSEESIKDLMLVMKKFFK